MTPLIRPRTRPGAWALATAILLATGTPIVAAPDGAAGTLTAGGALGDGQTPTQGEPFTVTYTLTMPPAGGPGEPPRERSEAGPAREPDVEGPAVPELTGLTLSGSRLTDRVWADGRLERTLTLTLTPAAPGPARIGAVTARVGAGGRIRSAAVDLTVRPGGVGTAGIAAGLGLAVVTAAGGVWLHRKASRRRALAPGAPRAGPVVDLAALVAIPHGAAFLDRARHELYRVLVERFGPLPADARRAREALARAGAPQAQIDAFDGIASIFASHRYSPDPPAVADRERVVALLKEILIDPGRKTS